MGVIVLPRQPNPLLQMGVNLIGGLLTDAIQRGRENAKNKQLNLARNAIDEQVALNAPPTTNFMGGLLNTPAGYNDNAWAQAFHKTETPLQQFDIGTASMIPQPVRQPQEAYIPTQLDYMKAKNQVLAQPKYSGVDAGTIDALTNPIMQEYGKAYEQARRQKTAENLMNTANSSDLFKQTFGAAVRGDVPESMIPYAWNSYTHDNLSAAQQADLQYKNAVLAQDWRKHLIPSGGEMLRDNTTRYTVDTESDWRNADRAEAARIHDDNQSIAERRQTLEEEKVQYEQDYPKLEQILSDDGAIYLVNPRTGETQAAIAPDGRVIHAPDMSNKKIMQTSDGSFIVVNIPKKTATTVRDQQGNVVKGTSKGGNISVREKEILKDLREEEKNLRKEIEKENNTVKWFSEGDPEYKQGNERISILTKQLEEVRAKKEALLNGGTKTNSPQLKAPLSQDVQNPKLNNFIPIASNDDVRPTVQTVQPQPPKRRKVGDMLDVKYPKTLIYDPSRDKDIPKEKLFNSMEEFSKWLGNVLGKKELQNYTPEEIIVQAISSGIRVKN